MTAFSILMVLAESAVQLYVLRKLARNLLNDENLLQTYMPDIANSTTLTQQEKGHYADAFRHAYTSAQIVMEMKSYGLSDAHAKEFAKILGAALELTNPFAPGTDTNMDYWNNRIGREIGGDNSSLEEIGEAIADAISSDYLIIDHVNDLRAEAPDPDDILSGSYDLSPMDLASLTTILENFVPHQSIGTTGTTIANMFGSLTGGIRYGDPLTIDMDRDGQVDLRPINDGRVFDVDEDGFDERVGWVKAEDGMLARDLNSDGEITEQSELFGNPTTSGFTALSALDSNSDGKIDVNDTAFNTLLIWQDANQDGIGQAGELQTLTAVGIKSISLTTTNTNYLVEGNSITKEGTVTWTDNSTSKAFDVNLALNNFFTRYNEEYELNPEVLFLPTLRGYGTVADLHISMSLDEGLLERVKDFTEISLSDYRNVKKEIQNILIDWTNADTKPAHTMYNPSGNSLSSEQIYVLEGINGVSHLTNAVGYQAGVLFDRTMQMYGNRLIMDVFFKNVTPDLSYNLNADKFEGSVDWENLVDEMASFTPLALDEKILYWRDMISLLNEIGTNLSVSQSAYSTLVNDALVDADIGLTFANLSLMNGHNNTAIGNSLVTGTDIDSGQFLALAQVYARTVTSSPPVYTYSYSSGDDIIIGLPGAAYFGAHVGANLMGGAGNDTIYGTYLNDIIEGNNDNDLLYGREGNDNLSGNEGNDVIHGEQGNDKLYGGGQNDAIYGGEGDDYIRGDAGNDLIFGDSGNDDIDGGTGKDVIHGGDGNDTIRDLDDDVIFGDDGNDTITGGGNASQTLEGGAGNDLLQFDNPTITGPNTIARYQNGGDGDDILTVSRGINFLDGGAGDDIFLWDWNVGSINVIPNGVFITDDSGNDTLKIIDAQSAGTLEKFGNDMLVYYNGYTITIRDQFLDPGNLIIDTLQVVTAGGATTYDKVVDLLTWTPVSGTTWTGTNGADSSLATGYSDLLYGLGGNDSLNGFAGQDYIDGGAGDDYMDGGGQDDILIGGTGNDTLYGGNGNDTYRFQVGDGQDIINFETNVESYADTVEFTDATVLANLNFNASGSSLDVYYGINDSIRLTNYTTIENLKFSSQSYVLADQINIVAAGSVALNQTYTFKADLISGSVYADTVYLAEGNDTARLGNGNDVAYGEEGNDWLYGDAGNDTLDGGNGNDKLYGGANDDTYIASSGIDTFAEENSGGTDKILFGGSILSGDISFYRQIGTQTNLYIDWGVGNQIRIINPFAGANYFIEKIEFYDNSMIDLSTANYITKGTDSGETIFGLTAPYGLNDTIYGFDGNDTIHGGSGSDTLYGGNGSDTLNGNADNDVLYGEAGANSLYGNDGNDIIYGGDDIDIIYGGNNDDVIYAGEGNDTQLYGESGNDTIFGEGGNDNLSGGVGNDLLYGGDGNDTLSGGNDGDILDGGSGNDLLNGEAGDDTYIYSSGMDVIGTESGGTDLLKIVGGATINDITTSLVGSSLKVILNSGVNEMNLVAQHASGTTYSVDHIAFDDGFVTTLTDQASWLRGNSADNTLTGTSLHNTLIGYAGNDILDGAGGNDDLHGGVGDDTVKGGDGDDLLHGGTGNDLLYGQAGLDTMFGGTGGDTFIFEAVSAFSNVDVIKDFNDGESDAINIADLLTGYTSGVSDINDFCSVVTSGSNTQLFIDRDGTGSTYTSQQIATLNGVTGLDVDTLLANNNLIAV